MPFPAFPRVPTSKNNIGGSGKLQIAPARPARMAPATAEFRGIFELQACNSGRGEYGRPTL
ncbi:hypothetical protein ARTHRO8AJ_290046 [Arthrobacter sp. 8AJ]|nr:hypothetical protein ARTHRO8AJ_290046 [Arthrobacter sp. 8AJ]